MSRFNLRLKPRISYYEPDEPSLDEYVFCDECGDFVYEYCSIHGPLLIVPDDKVPAVSPYPPCVPRAALTIPSVFLHIARSTIPNAGLGVFTTLTLPRGVRFGPYRGQRVTEADSEYCWQIYDRNHRKSHLVDAADPNRSNWMRYVNCSRHWFEQNLVAFQYQGQLYYRTIKIIPRFTELLVFYGSEFANTLHVNLKLYCSPRGYAQKLGAPLAKKSKLASDDNAMLEEKEDRKNEAEEKKKSASEKEDRKNIAEEKKKSACIITHLPATVVNTETKKGSSKRKLKRKTKTSNNIQKDIKHETSKDTTQKPETVTTKTNIADNNLNSDTNNNNVIKPIYGNEAYTCDICSFSTHVIKYLEAHLRAHAASTCFSCDLCPYKTTVKQSLESHHKMHAGTRQYPCKFCNKKFTHQGNLEQHIRTHTGEKPYVCNVCNQKFTQLASLKTHIRTHTGEKPYVCNVCNRKFTESGKLKNHIRTHTGEKPYVCNVCNRKCTTSSNLKDHIRTHTGEKPYVCNVCNRQFTQSSNLKTHIRMVHK